MLRAGVSFPGIMKLLGHSTPDMTMRYLGIALPDLQREYQQARSPDAFVLVIVALASAPSMANDCVVVTNWTTPRQALQRNHPGSMLSSASGSAIKRITAGVKAAADRPCQVSI